MDRYRWSSRGGQVRLKPNTKKIATAGERRNIMARIVIPDDDPPQIKGTKALEELERWGEVKLYNDRARSQEELITRMRGADVAINVRAYSKFTREVLSRCSPPLKLLSILGTGTDNVDLSAAREYGVLVTNTPGFAAPAVAEHALALMLAVARQITQLNREVRNGGCVDFSPFTGEGRGMRG